MGVEPSSAHPTKRAMDSGDFATKLGLYYAQAVSRFDGESKSHPLPLTQTVGRLSNPLFSSSVGFRAILVCSRFAVSGYN